MLVCLDVDGCLIDSDRPMMAALNDAFTSVGLPELTLDDVRPHLGPPLVTTLNRLLATTGADAAIAPTLARRYREVYAGISVAETVAYPGVDGCLQTLADAGHRLVVVSSKPTRFSRPVLEALDLLGHFDAVYGPIGDETEPKTETLARALRDDPDHPSVMVGDTVQDVAAARANASHAIAVSWGYGDRDDLDAARPDALIGSPAELPGAIADLRTS